MSNDPVKKKPPSKQLRAWLKKQAAKLQNIVTRGWKLQAAFLQNAKAQGNVLVEVHERLKGTAVAFDQWVEKHTNLGVSTAYLWKDVAEWWPELEARWNSARKGDVSTPLEISIRQVRDQIRDLKQAQGIGKPGSGRRKAAADVPNANGETPATNKTADQQDADDHDEGGDAPAIEDKKYTKLMGRFQRDGDMHNGNDRKKMDKPAYYKVTVVTSVKADREKFGELLPSPITDFKANSVSASIRIKDIDKTLTAVGNTLSTVQPKKVRIVIEL